MIQGFRTPDSAGERVVTKDSGTFNPDKRLDTRSAVEPVGRAFNPDKQVKAVGIPMEVSDISRTELLDMEIKKTLREYFKELKQLAEYPEMVPNRPFDASEIERRSPEEVKTKRVEFKGAKSDLIEEWEVSNGRQWPRYEQGVYVNNKLIRRAGDRYDAHHIKPLFAGGENTADNITPISVEKHYDKQGIHAPGGPCDRIMSLLERKQ